MSTASVSRELRLSTDDKLPDPSRRPTYLNALARSIENRVTNAPTGTPRNSELMVFSRSRAFFAVGSKAHSPPVGLAPQ